MADADVDVADTTKSQTPGSLRGDSAIKLETVQAQLLYTGRKKRPDAEEILGLRGFGFLLVPIWNSVRSETPDPYGEYWLIKIEQALSDRTAEIDLVVDELRQLSESATKRSFTDTHSVEPLEIPLRFSVPHAHKGAEMLARYDNLCLLALQSHHYGLLTDQQVKDYVYGGGHAVRSVFEVPKTWRQLGITRDDLKQKNAKALQAIEAMGELPQELINGELRPALTPRPLRNLEFFRHAGRSRAGAAATEGGNPG